MNVVQATRAQVGHGQEHAHRAKTHKADENDLGPWRIVWASAMGGVFQLTSQLPDSEMSQTLSDLVRHGEQRRLLRGERYGRLFLGGHIFGSFRRKRRFFTPGSRHPK